MELFAKLKYIIGCIRYNIVGAVNLIVTELVQAGCSALNRVVTSKAMYR